MKERQGKVYQRNVLESPSAEEEEEEEDDERGEFTGDRRRIHQCVRLVEEEVKNRGKDILLTFVHVLWRSSRPFIRIWVAKFCKIPSPLD